VNGRAGADFCHSFHNGRIVQRAWSDRVVQQWCELEKPEQKTCKSGTCRPLSDSIYQIFQKNVMAGLLPCREASLADNSVAPCGLAA